MTDSSPASASSSSLVSVQLPPTLPYLKCNFLDKDTGRMRLYLVKKNLYFNVDLNEKPVWNNEIELFLFYWLQQKANHNDIFGRYDAFCIIRLLLSFITFSFRSANAHTESLGEVDVISDAEVYILISLC
jgi:hypothetical protein